MSNKTSIYEIIKNYFLSFIENEQFYSRTGKVISVQNDATCTVQLTDSAELEGVRLQQVKNDTGLILVPAVNSQVRVSFTDNVTGYIATYSEVEGVVYQNGTNGGLVKVSELVDKLNVVEGDLNDLKQAFTSWIVVVGDGGTALKAITAAWAAQSITETEVVDLANEKFKH